MGDIDKIVDDGEKLGKPAEKANLGYFEDGKENADNAFVLVAHYDFKNIELLARNGDAEDVSNLENTFKERRNCNFRCLSSPKKEHLLQLLANKEKLLRFFASKDVPAVLVLYILSHGNKDGVIYTDHKQSESSKDLICFTTDDIFASLKGLSGFDDCLKLINFGPCRGEFDDEVVRVAGRAKNETFANKNSCRITYIPGMQNLVIFYSTVETTKARRDDSGSTFARLSCQVLDSMEKDEPLINVLTSIQFQVHKNLSEKSTGFGQTPEIKYFSQSKRFFLYKSRCSNTSKGVVSEEAGGTDFYPWVLSSRKNSRRRHAFLLFTNFDETVKQTRKGLALNLDFEVSSRALSAASLKRYKKEASDLAPNVGCILTCIFAPVKKVSDEVYVLVNKDEIKMTDIVHGFVGPDNKKWIGKPKLFLIFDQKTTETDDMSPYPEFEITATNHSGWLVLVLHDQEKYLELIKILMGHDLKRGKSLQEMLVNLLISNCKETKNFLNGTLQYKLDFPNLPTSFVHVYFSREEVEERAKRNITFDELLKESSSPGEKIVWVLSAAAGAGKSTVLKEMAYQMGRSFQTKTLLIELTKISFVKLNRLGVIELLARLANYSTEEIDEWIENRNCIVMFDGFDEISPKFRKKVLKIVDFLKENKIPVWIGTRPHEEKEFLGVAPNAVFVRIEPLNEEKQIEILQMETGKSEDECKQFVETFSAKNLLENALSLILAQSSNRSNVYQIYKQVLQQKIESYLVQWVGLDRNSTQFVEEVNARMELLQRIASRHVGQVAIAGRGVREDCLEKVNGSGVATYIDERLEFIHTTFAEFLTTKQFLYNIGPNCDPEKFEEISTNGFLKCLRFVDAYLSITADEVTKKEIECHILSTARSTPDDIIQTVSYQNLKTIFSIVKPHITFSDDESQGDKIYCSGNINLLLAAVSYADDVAADLLDTDLIRNGDSTLVQHAGELLIEAARNDAFKFLTKLQKKYPRLPHNFREKNRLYAQEDFSITYSQGYLSRTLNEHFDLILLAENDVNKADEKGKTAIHCAALYGHLKLVRRLIESNADVRAKDAYGWNAFHFACASSGGHAREIIRSILDKDAQLCEEKTCDGQTGLHILVSNDGRYQAGIDSDAISWLVEQSCTDLSAKNDANESVLLLACKNRKWDVAKLLLSKHVQVNEQDFKGMTALHYAAKCDDTELLLQFIDHGADLTLRDHEGKNVLHHSVDSHRTVLLLHERNGTLVSQTTEKGDTTLHLALRSAWHVDTSLVRLLIQHVDLKAINDSGETALLLACKKQRREIIEILSQMGKGVDVNAQDRRGKSALHHAAERGFSNIVQTLLEEGGDLALEDNDGMNVLHHASRSKVLPLHDKNENLVKRRLKKGDTTLHVAIKSRSHDSIKWLVENGGIDLNATNDSGETALMLACKNKLREVAELLLSKNVDINAVDQHGASAVHYAAQYCGLALLEILVEKGADLSLTDHKGNNALVYANEDFRSIKFMHEKNRDLVKQQLADGNTFLHWAIQNYELRRDVKNEVIVWLLEQDDVNLNAKNSRGETPLIAACKRNEWLFPRGNEGWHEEEEEWWDAWGFPEPEYEWGRDDWSSPRRSWADDWDVANMLLDKNVDVSATDENGRTALHYAAQGQDIPLMKRFIWRGCDLASSDHEGKNVLHYVLTSLITLKFVWRQKKGLLKQHSCTGDTTLHIAIKTSYMDEVTYWLVEQGDVDLNATNDSNETVLLLACKLGKWNVAKFLLAKGAAVNFQDNAGMTALHYAAKSYDLELLQQLLEHGADLTLKDNEGRNVLHSAESLQTASFIHERRGSLIKERSNKGDTVLHVAIKSFQPCAVNIVMIRWLVEQKDVDLNATNQLGETALLLALKQRQIIVAKLMLQTESIEVNTQDQEGHSALHYAAQYGNIDLMEMLVGKGGDLSLADNDGMNVVHHAINDFNPDVHNFHHTFDSKAMLMFIHDKNKDLVKQRLNNGDTTLHLATKKCYYRTDVIIWLVENGGIDSDARNDSGETALLLACKRRIWKMAKLLMRTAVDVASRDEKGRTALHYAAHCQSKDVDLVQKLLEKGADLDWTDDEGKNVLQHASTNKAMLEFIHARNESSCQL